MALRKIATLNAPILRDGSYTLPNGDVIFIDTATCTQGTRTFTPDELDAMLDVPIVSSELGAMQIQTVAKSTQEHSRYLVQSAGIEDLAILNFASARNPCGGYLTGAKAQEEDLARCSALYNCLTTDAASLYFKRNRRKSKRASDMLYTSHMIYSPAVPFFRDQNYNLLNEPFKVSVITAPAPNGRAFLNRVEDLQSGETELSETILRRAGQILTIAKKYNHRNVLLGAWGCGVFGNDPNTVADSFKYWLDHLQFRNSFDLVVFAVLAPRSRPDIIKPFERIANSLF